MENPLGFLIAFLLEFESAEGEVQQIAFADDIFLPAFPAVCKSRFLDNIWDVDSRAEENTVWTYISYLRRKLEVIDANVQIRTMRGAGYILEVRR